MAEEKHTRASKNATAPRAGTARFRSCARVMAAAFVVALAVRLVYVFAFRASPYFAVPIVDAAWHDAWAWDWARGAWNPGGEAYFRAPLYPFWLSLVYRVFGHDLLAARLVQAVIGAGTAAALAGAGWRLGGRSAGLWAGAIAALYGPFVFYDGELLIPNLLLALLCWSLFFLLAGGRPRMLFAAFLLVGLAAVARPNALVLIPLFAWAAWPALPPVPGRRCGRAGLVAAMVALALAPAAVVTALNVRAEGTFVFIASQGGVNFYAGNNPNANGRTLAVEELAGARGSWADFVRASRDAAERAEGRRLTSREVSGYWSGKAWAWIRSSPADALALTARKAAFLANSYEIPNNRDLYFDRPFPLNILLWNAGWFSFPWGIVFPLAVAGAAAVFAGTRKRPDVSDATRRRSVAFLSGWFFLYALSLLPFFVCARFRMPMVPPVVLLAALALAGGRRTTRSLPLAALAAAFLLANNTLFDARATDRTQEAARRGVVLVAAGRLDEGREALRALIEAQKHRTPTPSYLGEFAYHLGDAYAREGKTEEAARWFAESLALGCRTTRLLAAMAGTLSDIGRYAEAREALERALEGSPSDAGLWGDLGSVLDKAGAREEAAGAYRRAIDLAPNNPQFYNSLGLIYHREANLDSAVAVWGRGAARAPGSTRLHFNLALTLALQGRPEAALAAIDRALAIAPEDSTARALRADILDELGAPTK